MDSTQVSVLPPSSWDRSGGWGTAVGQVGLHGCLVDVGAGDGGGPVPGDLAMEPVEQLLVDVAMSRTESGAAYSSAEH